MEGARYEVGRCCEVTLGAPVYLLVSPVYLLVSPVYLLVSPVYLLVSPVYLVVSPVYLLVSPVYLLVSISSPGIGGKSALECLLCPTGCGDDFGFPGRKMDGT